MRPALLVVDVQADYCKGGSPAVTGGRAVAAAVAGRLADDRTLVELAASGVELT